MGSSTGRQLLVVVGAKLPVGFRVVQQLVAKSDKGGEADIAPAPSGSHHTRMKHPEAQFLVQVTAVNPGFRLDKDSMDAGAQALFGFIGALGWGPF